MVKVSICNGPVCRMCGAKELRESFEKELEKAGIADQVELHEGFCMGECKNGPCVRIDGVKFRRMDTSRVAQLIKEEVMPKITA